MCSIGRFFRFVCVSILLLAVSACATPTAEELANADFGSYPTDYKQIVKSYTNNLLKDPYSAQWRHIIGPSTGWNAYFGATQYGYIVCYGINAKNAFGGYTGEKIHYFMIKNDVVVKHIYEKGRRYDFGGAAAQAGCSQ